MQLQSCVVNFLAWMTVCLSVCLFVCPSGKTKFKRTHLDHFMNTAVLYVSHLAALWRAISLMHIHTYTYMRTYIFTHIHTHSHTHTHAAIQILLFLLACVIICLVGSLIFESVYGVFFEDYARYYDSLQDSPAEISFLQILSTIIVLNTFVPISSLCQVLS